MLQVAYGGYLKVEDSESYYEDNIQYEEPGFGTTDHPLEFEIPESDRIYFLLRKRDSRYGDSFDSLDYSNIVVSAKDVTNGEDLPSYVYEENTIYEAWESEDNPSGFENVLFSVDTVFNLAYDDIFESEVSDNKTRTIDVYVKDVSDNSFVFFRIFVQSSNMQFHYICVPEGKMDKRNLSSLSYKDAYIDMNQIDNCYILISPMASFKEYDGSDYTFSYPYNTIFYKRQNVFNNEEYTFSISDVSDSWISDCVSIIPVPQYQKVCVLRVDSYLKTKMYQDKNYSLYLYISVTGKVTGITNSFKVVFSIG